MCLYLMRKLNIVGVGLLQTDEQLHGVLNLIEVGSYDEARKVWLNHASEALGQTEEISTNNSGNRVDLHGDTSNYTQASPTFR